MTASDQRTSRYTRRTVLARAAGGAAALGVSPALLAACGGDDDSGGGGGGGELNAWMWGDAANMNDWLRDVTASFKSANGPDVQVAMQQTETLVANFQAAAAARKGPDVAAQWATQPVLAQAWADAVEPLDDLVPESERAHWVFSQENQYGGKQWAAPLYIIGQPFCYNKKLFEQAGLDPETPPTTWDELLETCRTLKSKGITPLAIGNKDTFGGRWAWAFLAVQTLDSLDDLKAPLLGDASFADPKFSEWATRWKELIDNDYYNEDAMSLDADGGRDVFTAGKAAMAWTVENGALEWGEALGEENVAQLDFPKYGSGSLAEAYTATQSTSYFITSWAADKEASAQFLQFMHEPAQLKSQFETCNVIPADDRFDRSVVTNPLQKALAERASQGLQIWLENWIPPEVDETANGPGGQKLMTGGSVEEVTALWDQQAKVWREQNPDIAKRFSEWQMTPVSL
jgi:ABC-type glycerol-3-phosphate transport system substrate-binding protein